MFSHEQEQEQEHDRNKNRNRNRNRIEQILQRPIVAFSECICPHIAKYICKCAQFCSCSCFCFCFFYMRQQFVNSKSERSKLWSYVLTLRIGGRGDIKITMIEISINQQKFNLYREWWTENLLFSTSFTISARAILFRMINEFKLLDHQLDQNFFRWNIQWISFVF